MSEPWTALVVEDSGPARLKLVSALERAGATVLAAGSVTEAFALMMESPIELALVDLDLPGERGLTVLQHLRAEGSERVPVLMFSASDDAAARADAFEQGADDCLVMPVAPVELTARVNRLRRRALTLARLERETGRLELLSITDPLTQVHNRRHFEERLQDEFRRAQRYDDPLALILLDMDHLKQLNEVHGAALGDEVLRGLAGVLGDAVRETDFVARSGGGAFAVLLPKTPLAGALTVAERISNGARRLRVGLDQVRVTASFGLSSFPGRQINVSEQLFRTADDALRRAKAEGRNRICLAHAVVGLSTAVRT